MVCARPQRYRSHAIGWLRHLAGIQIRGERRADLAAAAKKFSKRYRATEALQAEQGREGDDEALAVDYKRGRVKHSREGIQVRLRRERERERRLRQPLSIQHQSDLPRKH